MITKLPILSLSARGDTVEYCLEDAPAPSVDMPNFPSIIGRAAQMAKRQRRTPNKNSTINTTKLPCNSHQSDAHPCQKQSSATPHETAPERRARILNSLIIVRHADRQHPPALGQHCYVNPPATLYCVVRHIIRAFL